RRYVLQPGHNKLFKTINDEREDVDYRYKVDSCLEQTLGSLGNQYYRGFLVASVPFQNQNSDSQTVAGWFGRGIGVVDGDHFIIKYMYVYNGYQHTLLTDFLDRGNERRLTLNGLYTNSVGHGDEIIFDIRGLVVVDIEQLPVRGLVTPSATPIPRLKTPATV
ncbi:hypothetical protein J6590_100304, partial [Homalodisca vitripennis]